MCATPYSLGCGVSRWYGMCMCTCGCVDGIICVRIGVGVLMCFMRMYVCECVGVLMYYLCVGVGGVNGVGGWMGGWMGEFIWMDRFG